MARNEQVPGSYFLKSTDIGKDITIHTKKNSHTKVTKRIGISFDTTIKCLDLLLCISLVLVMISKKLKDFVTISK